MITLCKGTGDNTEGYYAQYNDKTSTDNKHNRTKNKEANAENKEAKAENKEDKTEHREGKEESRPPRSEEGKPKEASGSDASGKLKTGHEGPPPPALESHRPTGHYEGRYQQGYYPEGAKYPGYYPGDGRYHGYYPERYQGQYRQYHRAGG